ncbi:hypothetical protein FDP41_013630 [Naegleria fowleri]|uniref:Protein kinase domain-containing protein n=1 Tax=Naegleria fowleri TaxID=5763 RepID=A0A6A5BYF8_NAEFO|nr:uncharacterized protein FDP41_013630 [Naegleria fowleri]KAF0980416.1 hypothetical protein FDP41_013630 [Naegleria fowleri]
MLQSPPTRTNKILKPTKQPQQLQNKHLQIAANAQTRDQAISVPDKSTENKEDHDQTIHQEEDTDNNEEEEEEERQDSGDSPIPWFPPTFFSQNFRRCSITSESQAINLDSPLLVIGNYQVNRDSDCLGQNWYYKIYKGYHIQTGNFVVMKHIYNQDIIPKLRNRIEDLRERIAESRSEHPFIAHMFASVTLPVKDSKGNVKEGEEFYAVVEEFLENGSLFMLRNKGYRPSEKVIVMYIDQVLQGILYLHNTLKIAHLNLSSKNVMLSKYGQIKLADIGFIMTKEEYIKNKPCLKYCSPLMFHMTEGDWEKQALADIWSVGCLVIELFTGKPPFHDYSWEDLFQLFQEENFPVHLIDKYFPPNCSELALDFLRCCFYQHDYSRSYIKSLTHHPWILKYKSATPQHVPTEYNLQGGVSAKYLFMVHVGSRKKKLSTSETFQDIQSLETFIYTKCDHLIASLKRKKTSNQIVVIEIFDKECNEFVEFDDLSLLEEAPAVNQLRVSCISLPSTPKVDPFKSIQTSRYVPSPTSSSFTFKSDSFSYKTDSISASSEETFSPSETGVLLWNGRYLPLKKIQSGGFSSVYLCEDCAKSPSSSQKRVALKVCSVDNSGDNTLLSINEAMREAFQMMMFNHPNIIKVLDVFQQRLNPISSPNDLYSPQMLCIVMPYYDEGDLTTLIRSPQQLLSPRIILTIMLQVMDALCELHSRNVIHRDVKPQNILIEKIEKDNKGAITRLKVLLCDFGLSKSLIESKAFSVSGTINYMSPEAQLNQGYGVKTDIWSAGVVLYQLLTSDERTNIFLEMIQRGEETVLNNLEENIKERYKTLPSSSQSPLPQLESLLRNMLKFSQNDRISAKDAFNYCRECMNSLKE